MKIPTLSTDGWVDDPTLKLKLIYDYWIYSDYSQSYIYYNEVSSLKWLLAEYKDDEEELKYKAMESLKKMLNVYFYNSEVTIWTTYPNGESGDLFNLHIDIVAYKSDDENAYKLNRIVSTRNGVFVPMEEAVL